MDIKFVLVYFDSSSSQELKQNKIMKNKNPHIKICYDAGGYNVMTLKAVMNKFKNMPESFKAHLRDKILSGGFQLDGAYYSVTDEQITIL